MFKPDTTCQTCLTIKTCRCVKPEATSSLIRRVVKPGMFELRCVKPETMSDLRQRVVIPAGPDTGIDSTLDGWYDCLVDHFESLRIVGTHCPQK